VSQNQGLLIVLSGPSGVGKGTVCHALLNMLPGLKLSVSVTTRPPRAGEVEGINYYFVSKKKFFEMVAQDKLLEWAHTYDFFYGTPREAVNHVLNQGKDLILEIDVQGGMQVKQRFSSAITIFLYPPSMEELLYRLKKRASDSPEDIQKRLHWAAKEMQMSTQYDYVVVNDLVENAVSKILAILTAEKCKRMSKAQ
jgi:guanylate kinase